MSNKIEVRLVADRLRIYINGILHLSINNNELVGIQSWKFGDYKFAIDYYLKHGKIETYYVSFDDWRSILEGLEKIQLV